MIGRAAAEPLSEPIVARLREPVDKSPRPHTASYAPAPTRWARARIRLCLARSTKRSQDSSRLSRSYDVRGPTRALPAENVGRLYALRFAPEQLRQNFEDFRNRVTECARADREA
jgi:hypothetical protein